MISFFQTIILGIVEGITEFLPISSTGHLILTSKIFHLQEDNFLKSFQIAIQSGAIFAVFFLYWKSFFKKEILKRIVIAFLPTALVGIIFYKIFKTYLFNYLVVLWSLFFGGIFLILFEKFYKEKKKSIEEISQISYKNSFLIGFFQSFAIIPGISRAGATILGGLALGLKRKTIVEFSFLLAVPTMIGATIFDLFQTAYDFAGKEIFLLILGFLVSFFVALGAVKFFLRFIKKHNFVPFGIYRIFFSFFYWLLVK